MSYGNLLFTAGLILAGGGGIALLAGTAAFAAKRKSFRRNCLTDTDFKGRRAYVL